MNPTPSHQFTDAGEIPADFRRHDPRPVRLRIATLPAAHAEGWVLLLLLTLFTASLAVLVLAR